MNNRKEGRPEGDFVGRSIVFGQIVRRGTTLSEVCHKVHDPVNDTENQDDKDDIAYTDILHNNSC